MNPAGITLKQIRAVDAVGRYQSITRAAEALGLTPPAVHSQIRLLEEYIGSELVKRTSSAGMELTSEGKIIQSLQKVIDSNLESSLAQINAMRRGLAGSVRLGVVSTGKYFAPALVAGLKRALPDIEVALIVGNRDDIIEALAHRSVDLVVMGRPPRIPEVKAVPIGPHPHVIVAPPDHQLVGRTDIPAADLLKETFISREPGSGTRILMTRYLDRIGQGTTYDTLVMNSNETIKQAVIAGLGVALISQHTVTDEIKSGRLALLHSPELPIVRQWFLLHRADQELSPAQSSVWDFVCNRCSDYFPALD